LARGFGRKVETDTFFQSPFLKMEGQIKTSGFTLIEIMVVLAIIAVLIVMSLLSISTIIWKTKIDKVVSDVWAFERACGEYYIDLAHWPGDVGPGTDPGFVANNGEARWKGPYLQKWPESNPFGGNWDFENWGFWNCTIYPAWDGQRDICVIWVSIRGLDPAIIEKIVSNPEQFHNRIMTTPESQEGISFLLHELPDPNPAN